MKRFITPMMVILCLNFIFLLTGICAGKDICSSPEEVRPRCGKPLACQEHCPTSANEPLAICLAVCVDVCSCAEGYVRNTTGGPCILRSECPPIQEDIICSSPEEVRPNCGIPLACQEHCPTNASGPVTICSADCVDVCSCADGYVRNTTGGPCILRSECPPIQEDIICKSPEEVRPDCGMPLNCQEHCTTNASEPLIPCPRNCVDECSCADGYVRETIGGRCILRCECPSN